MTARQLLKFLTAKAKAYYQAAVFLSTETDEDRWDIRLDDAAALLRKLGDACGAEAIEISQRIDPPNE